MLAGQLRRRLTIQKRNTTPDEFGAQATTWTDVCTLWCAAQPTAGTEQLAGGAVRSVQKFLFTTRYWPGISPANRILFEGLTFDITNVNDIDQRHKTLEIMATEGLTDG